jgi:hypothetical protein
MVNGFIWLRVVPIGGFLCAWFDLSAFTRDADAPPNLPTHTHTLKKVAYLNCFHINYHDDYAY